MEYEWKKKMSWFILLTFPEQTLTFYELTHFKLKSACQKEFSVFRSFFSFRQMYKMNYNFGKRSKKTNLILNTCELIR